MNQLTTDAFIDEVEGRLRIDKDALDQELIEHAEIYYEIGSRLALWSADRDEIKESRKKEEAEHYMDLRKAAEETGQKCTEALLNRTLDAIPPTDLQIKLDRFTRYVKRLDALKEAWYQRGHALRELCGLHAQNYYQTDRVLERRERF